MTLPNQILSLPVSYDSYIRHGWYLVPIAPQSKGPKSPNWNRKENCLTSHTQLPAGYGVGLAHAYSGTCAIDIDDWDTAAAYLKTAGIDLQSLFDAPDSVAIDSGNKGHGKLLYATPFGMTLTSKKLIATRADTTKYNFLDFRCATANNLTVQDLLPPSIHPTTQQPYRWSGKGHWERLPILPIPLLTLWQSLLDQDQQRVLKTDSKLDTSWEEVRSALSSINPDCDRTTWVTLGMALQHGGAQQNQQDTAYQVFDEWSSQGQKYKGQQDINNVWRSFKPDHGVTLGSLFHYAAEAGWKRPMPDVSHLFAGIHVNDPDTVINEITLKMQPPKVPVDLFPKVLAQRASEAATDCGCEPAIPLMAGLAAVCAAVDSRTRLHVGGSFYVPPILWLMTIGDPSVKKSPGAKQMFAPLGELERSDRDRYQAEHLIWKGKEAAHAASMKAFLVHSEQASSHLTNDVVPGVTPLPEEPKALRLVVNDSTSQKIVHLAKGRPRGFLLHLDEMKNWADKINDPRSGEDRGCWIQGYESGPYTMDRVTAGTISAENLGIAIYGNLQPRVFEHQLSRMSDDGLLQRFIPVTVRSDTVIKWKPIPDYLTNKAEYSELIRKLYALESRTYTLSPAAYAIYDQFQDYYGELMMAEKMIQSSDIYLTALGKAEGTCCRLALVFHLLDAPYSEQVSEATMRRAADTMRQFVIPSLRFAFNHVEDGLEEWIKDHIIQIAGEHLTISIGDIKRSAKRKIEALNLTNDYHLDSKIRMILDSIAAHGWLALLEEHRRGVIYSINPAIATMFAERRQKIIKSKAVVRESILDVVERRYGSRPANRTIGL